MLIDGREPGVDCEPDENVDFLDEAGKLRYTFNEVRDMFDAGVAAAGSADMNEAFLAALDSVTSAKRKRRKR